MAIPTDKDQRLTEAELLNTPEQNLPVALAATLRARREAVKQKKDTVRFEQDELRQSAHAKHDHENSAYEHQLIVETFHAAMRDIEYREDLLLKQIDREERRVRKRLQDIEDRAIKLHDGRRVYVGANGDYLDEQGGRLRGADGDEARRQHQNNPNAPTLDERNAVKEQCEAFRQMKQGIFDAREQRRREDAGSLSDDEMRDRVRGRTAAMARTETSFHEQLETTGSGYGEADYMAGFDDPDTTVPKSAPADSRQTKGTLNKTFGPAAEGQELQIAKNTPKPAGEAALNNRTYSF